MQGTFASLASEKIILRLIKLDIIMQKVIVPLVKNTKSSSKKIITSGNTFNPSIQNSKEKLTEKRKLNDKILQV